MKTAIIFGGTGFIGVFFAKFLLDYENYDLVYLYDLREIRTGFRKNLFNNCSEKIKFIRGDVRKRIDLNLSENISLVANFAAIHREPGHEDFEYYETNILGAENVCEWASKYNYNNLIFLSSISPYGSATNVKNENSLPNPNSPYGNSKLVAEKIHLTWQVNKINERKLLVARPGVVFGPSEGGNVSRLIKAVLKNYFVFMGNKKTRKAGIYVKELCNSLIFSMRLMERKNKNFVLYNACMEFSPSIKNYTDVVQKVSKKKSIILSLPYSLVFIISHVIDFFLRILKVNHPFKPTRIKKLVNSNLIEPLFLKNNDYEFLFSLETAFLDWKDSNEEDWR